VKKCQKTTGCRGGGIFWLSLYIKNPLLTYYSPINGDGGLLWWCFASAGSSGVVDWQGRGDHSVWHRHQLRLFTLPVRRRVTTRPTAWARSVSLHTMTDEPSFHNHTSCDVHHSMRPAMDQSSQVQQHSTSLPVQLWVLGSYQERSTQDWCSWSTVSVKAVRNQMVPPCAEWRGDNQATTPFGYYPSTAFLPVQPHSVHAR